VLKLPQFDTRQTLLQASNLDPRLKTHATIIEQVENLLLNIQPDGEMAK
jgi:hypothetical protein